MSMLLVLIILGLTEAAIDGLDLEIQKPLDDPETEFEDDSSPNWLPFKNMNAALRGYNIMEGDPLHKDRDPGFKHQIFEPTMKNAQDRYVIHPAYTYDGSIDCNLQMTVDVSSTVEEYR